MSKNQLKYVILAGLFVVPLVPLVVAKSLFFPFITGKAFVFRLIVEAIFVLWVVLAVKEKEYRPKFSWILGAVLLFLLCIGLSDIMSENPFKSFWSNYERMEGYIGLLHFAAYFVVAGSVLKGQRIWNKLLATSVGASVVMAVYSFFQLAGKIPINQGGVRVDGTFGNASYLGIYAVFHIFFSALLFFRSRNKIHKWLLAIAAVLNIVVLYNTATRGAILGFLGGALISLFYLGLKAEKGEKIRRYALAVFLGIIILAGAFVSMRNSGFVKSSPVLSRIGSLSLSEIKSQGRYFVWPIAWKGFTERPVFGWGQESFNFVFNKYYDARMYTQEPWFDRTHDIVLDWLIAGGLLGFLSYASIYFALLYHFRRARGKSDIMPEMEDADYLTREDKAIILGALAAYVFHNLFVFDQIGSYILFFTLLAYIHSHAGETGFSLWNKISSKVAVLADREGFRPVVESVAVITGLIAFYFVVFLPWKDNVNLLAVLKLNSDNVVGSAEVYKKPLQHFRMGFPESLEHVSQAVTALSTNPKASVELKQELYNQVDAAFKKFTQRVPDDARYRLFYGMFLTSFGNYEGATTELKKASELSPNKQSIYFQTTNSLWSQGKKEEALQTAKSAYEALPSYEEAGFVYGLMLLLSGQEAEANKILQGVPPERIIFDDRYVAVLQELGRYQEIINVVKQRVASDPKNSQYRINLAAAYLIAGMRESAIQVIQEMIAANPSFKEQGEYYISEIRAGRNP